jgi:NADPH:quinone reductase-like Zn-dependent oxidoreductase
VVYDTVGGVTTPAALASLARQGRLVAMSAVGTRTVEIDLVSLYRNETRIYGCNSANYDVVESSARLQRLAPFFDSGEFHAPSNIDRYSLDHGEDAYLALEKRGHDRIVICP